jgi:hypothetical protein
MVKNRSVLPPSCLGACGSGIIGSTPTSRRSCPCARPGGD